MSKLRANFKDKQTIRILESVYKNALLSHKATVAVLRRCRNNEFYGELSREQDRYKQVALRARRELSRMGAAAYQAPLCVRAAVSTGIAAKTSANRDTSALAEIMYKGTNNGVIDMQRTLNRARAADGHVRESARKLLEREQLFCENLRRFL